MGKLTIAMIVFKINSEIGKILVIYYIKTDDKIKLLNVIFPQDQNSKAIIINQ